MKGFSTPFGSKFTQSYNGLNYLSKCTEFFLDFVYAGFLLIVPIDPTDLRTPENNHLQSAFLMLVSKGFLKKVARPTQ